MSDEAVVRTLMRSATSRLIEKVIEKESLSLPAAMHKVYNSRLYGLMQDVKTGLYREGPVYLYGMLHEEELNVSEAMEA